MTIEEIQKQVQAIRDISDDAEVAHSKEDDLHLEFIKYVATFHLEQPELAAKAKLIASTSEINFPRWCA